MRHFDLTPFTRSIIGFDRVLNLLDNAGTESTGTGYPPYNIERFGENNYRISMAVAGFAEDDLAIEVKEGMLSIKGNRDNDADSQAEILHQGIAARNFERRFQLADHVEVSNASLKDGLLHIDLVRELPEVMKPRTIPISKNGKKKAKQIESLKA